jgi:hypothetical protein
MRARPTGARAGLALAIVVTLSACQPQNGPSGNGPVLNVPLGRVCGEKISTVTAKAVVFDGEDPGAIDVVIDEGSNCLTNESGKKSLYDVVMLPMAGEDYILSVESYQQGNSIFAPKLRLLGADGTVLRRVTHDDLMFRGTALTALLRAKPEERYLLILSDPDAVGLGESRIMDSTRQNGGYNAATGATFYVYTGATETHNMTYSHGGKVKVVVRHLPKRN